MTAMSFVQKDVVIYLHDSSIKAHGGTPGLRDDGLLESALGRPLNRWHYEGEAGLDVFDLASAYGFGLSKAHAFHDCNKRTAWATAATFLALNGAFIRPRVSDAIVQMVRLTAGGLNEAEFADWLRGLQPG